MRDLSWTGALGLVVASVVSLPSSGTEAITVMSSSNFRFKDETRRDSCNFVFFLLYYTFQLYIYICIVTAKDVKEPALLTCLLHYKNSG